MKKQWIVKKFDFSPKKAEAKKGKGSWRILGTVLAEDGTEAHRLAVERWPQYDSCWPLGEID